MKSGLSKARCDKALAKFRRTGKSVTSWARENGFCPALVNEILKGERPCHRGKSHKIAVLLGLKDGVIEED